MRRAVDWTFTVPFLVAFGLSMAAFDVPQRVARLFGPRAHEHVLASLQWVLLWCLRIAGTRFTIERHPAVERGRPYVVVSNHQSMFDIPVINWTLASNRPKFVSKKSLARGIPSVSVNLRLGGHALIDRKDRIGAIRIIREFGAGLSARGVTGVIFPEGTRARDGVMGPFRSAGAVALLESAPELPVVPVAIDGSWVLLRYRLRPVPFGTRVRASFGEPIPRIPGESASDVLARAEAYIRGVQARWREAGLVDPPAPEAVARPSGDAAI